MLKKIITYSLFSLCIIAFGAFVRFCGILRAKGAVKEVCKSVSIEILDSCDNKFVSPSSIVRMINRIDDPIGKNIGDIDPCLLEHGLTGFGAVRSAQVAVDRAGILHIQIRQRHPVLRFQDADKGYYMDDTGVCFPLSDLFTSDVPVVSGHIRIGDLKWKNGILELGRYLDNDSFWKTQIEQIHVMEDGQLNLFSRTSTQKISFGMPEDIESKLSRLLTFYKNIAPNCGWDCYSTVSLNYAGQIVCTHSEK